MSTDLDTFARTIWGEARGEGNAGMEAVANVIMNRVNTDIGNDNKPDWWGEGIEGVCRQPQQFSCWNPGDPNFALLGKVRAQDYGSFAAAIDIARRAMKNELPDKTGSATHYHTIKPPRPDMRWPPKWADGHTPTATIGRQVFYRLV